MISFTKVRNIAATFFCIGTLLFLLQITIGKSIDLIFVGLLFVVIAIIFNLIVLLVLIINLIQFDQLHTLKSIGIIVLNLPIAAGYLYLILEYS